MIQIYSDNIQKIIRNRKEIENRLKVKIETKDKIIFINGNAESGYLASIFLEAVNLGFSINKALLLTDEEFTLEKIMIKSITKRHNLSEVRARVIGAKRKAMDTIENLTDCLIALHGNEVGIIGRREDVKKAAYAIRNIIAGSKHSAMYSYLEKKKAEEKQSF